MDKRVVSSLIAILLLTAISLSIVAEKSTIYLEHSNTLSFDQDRLPDCQILTGDVQFRHEEALMYCDSAHFYSKFNSLHAFSNVRMVQGDSVRIYGDRLFYDGNSKLARLRNNIRMENGEATLFTDSFNYDRKTDIGYYFDHGTIVDNSNTLKSINGKYYSKSRTAIFQYNVSLENKDMRLKSDTLIYNTNTHIANIVGPSEIFFDDAWITSSNGWYDTDKDYSELYDRSLIQDYEGHNLTADTINYNRMTGIAEGFSNIVMNDSVDKIILTGGYGYYNEKIDSAYVIKLATLIAYEPESTDSTFVTADTLFYTKKDSVTYLKGYYNVQAWSPDFQGIADSVFYCTKDSIGRMFGTPVTWQGKNQATGDSILVFTANGEIDRIETIGSAFMFMKNDTLYNQISGKRVTCYVDSGELKKIFVDGNALSVYFAEEERDSTATPSDTINYVGVNRSESSEMTIYVDEDNKPKRIILTPASKGTLYTPAQISNKEITQLKGLLDCFTLKPLDQFDIYNPKDKSKLKAAEQAKPKHKRKKR